MRYSIVIPAFNESLRLGTTLEKIAAHITVRGWNAEVIVVNDGSRDDTAEVVRRAMLRSPFIRLVENPGNRGKGYSVRNGMLQARGEMLLFSDADLSSPIGEADKLFAALSHGAEVAIGSRWLCPELQTERQPLYRQVFGRLFNILLRIFLGLKFRDTQCGLKAFTSAAAGQIFPRQQIERWGFDPELLYLARRFHLKVVEVPVVWAHDERSKIRPLHDGLRMFAEVVRVRWYASTGRYSRPLEVQPSVAKESESSGTPSCR